MRTLNFKKIVSTLLYLGLAGFSCYWTAESLNIWQPNLTIYGGWFIAVVLYVIASFCFTWVLEALDRKKYFGDRFLGRGMQLFLAFIMFIVTWGVSLATNTHTLFYRTAVAGVMIQDLQRTQKYMKSLKNDNKKVKEIQANYNNRVSKIRGIVNKLDSEVDRPGAEGIGQIFERHVRELKREIPELNTTDKIGTNSKQWHAVVDFYRNQAEVFIVQLEASRDKEVMEVMELIKSDNLKKAIDNIDVALRDMRNMHGVSNQMIDAARKDLENGYSYVGTYAKYLDFENSKDKEKYTREGAIPEVQGLLAVDKVWRDYFFTHKFDGHGFLWWILISLLVDLSAFILFNIAFTKDENNAI